MKKRLTGTRIISGLLSAAMVVTMAPQTALSSFAQEDVPEAPLAESVSASEEEAAEFDSYVDSNLAILSPNSNTTRFKFYQVANNDEQSAYAQVVKATTVGSLATADGGPVSADSAHQFNSWYGYSFYVAPRVGYTWKQDDAGKDLDPVTLSGKVTSGSGDGAKTYTAGNADLRIEDVPETELGFVSADNDLSTYDASKYSWADAKKVTITGLKDLAETDRAESFLTAYVNAQNGVSGYTIEEGLNIAPVTGVLVPKGNIPLKIYEYDATKNVGYQYTDLEKDASLTYDTAAEVDLTNLAAGWNWKEYTGVGMQILTWDTDNGTVTGVEYTSDGNGGGTDYAKGDSAAYQSVADDTTSPAYFVDDNAHKVYVNAGASSDIYAKPKATVTTNSVKEIAIVLKKQTAYTVEVSSNSAIKLALADADKTYGAADVNASGEEKYIKLYADGETAAHSTRGHHGHRDEERKE